MRIGLYAAMCAVLLLSACGNTKFIESHRDQAFTGRAQKVFVLGITQNRGPRTLLEDEFVRQLRARGLTAKASTSLFSEEAVPTRDAVAAKVREIGADTVLVTRFIKKVSEEVYKPARIYAVPQNIDAEWERVSGSAAAVDPGIAEGSYDEWVVVMRTSLYSVAAGTVVWSSFSETTYRGPLLRQIKPFVSAVVGKLAKEKLVP